MASSNHFEGRSNSSPDKSESHGYPDWADGLRQLYDSVVDEPLPDAFKDLLDKLDDVPDKPESAETPSRPDEA